MSITKPAGKPDSAVHIRRRSRVALTSRLHTSQLVHDVLAARGVKDAQELKFALADLPRPESLLGIQAAVNRMIKARQDQQRVLIVGDYDCDGATSTCVALLGLRLLGFENVDYLVPDRFKYGYGLSPAIVETALASAPDLIVTVDNGVASVDGVEVARQAGVDVIVTDHHLPPPVLPRAVAIVNPNIPGATFPSKNLAGVGVIFYVLLALRARLVESAQVEPGVNLAALLDLVAIGTIADVVPMDKINRTLVEQGLRRIRAGQSRCGVLALLRCAGREPSRITSSDIGFALGPRLNAAGRLDDMARGIECLLSADFTSAMALATELDGLNQRRRSIEKRMQNDAQLQLTNLPIKHCGEEATFGLVLFEPEWHQGVIGIVAGRLKEQLHKPVIVFCADGEHTIKGSARSIPGVHIRDVLQSVATSQSGLIEKFGGHAMAAGLSLKRARYSDFAIAFDQEVKRCLHGKLPVREFLTDGSLSEADRCLPNARLLQSVAPWGQEFGPPVFDDYFIIDALQSVGTGHLKLKLRGAPSGDKTDSNAMDAIAFNQRNCFTIGDRVHVVYSLSVNHFRRTVALQLHVLYLKVENPLLP